MIVSVKQPGETEMFTYYTDVKPEKGESIGFRGKLYVILNVIHEVDEYRECKKIKLLVTEYKGGR